MNASTTRSEGAPHAIYVDLDDVLGATIETLIQVLAERHDKHVETDAVLHFDLALSFGLGAAEIEDFMAHVHRPEVLLAIEPIAGARPVFERWQRGGHGLHVVTGRPVASADASRAWLERHQLPFHSLQFVDKYGREPEGSGSLSLAELAGQRFDLVVEDSLTMARFAVEQWDVPVALIDRPWNRGLDALPGEVRAAIRRVSSWEELAARFPLD